MSKQPQQKTAPEEQKDLPGVAPNNGALVEQKAPEGAKTELQVYDFGDDAGAGMEGISADEYRIPFLRILDAKSPQCKPVERGGIEGAKAGDILNTSTNEVYDGKKGFIFLPVMRQHNFVEWIKKNDDGSGGGFVGIHEPNEPVVGELRAKQGRFGKLDMDNGNQMVETFYLTGLALVDGLDPFPAVIAFASTNIPTYQTFVNRAMNIKYPGPNGTKVNPPMWAHRWRLGSQFKERGQQNWYIWQMKLDAKNEDGTEAPARASLVGVKDPLYIQAKELYGIVQAGRAKYDYRAASGSDDGTNIPNDRAAAGQRAEESGAM